MWLSNLLKLSRIPVPYMELSTTTSKNPNDKNIYLVKQKRNYAIQTCALPKIQLIYY